jgi:predicted ester cyclase
VSSTESLLATVRFGVCGDAFDRIEDGKVVEHHAQFDAMGIMVQIGAVPVPG